MTRADLLDAVYAMRLSMRRHCGATARDVGLYLGVPTHVADRALQEAFNAGLLAFCEEVDRGEYPRGVDARLWRAG